MWVQWGQSSWLYLPPQPGPQWGIWHPFCVRKVDTWRRGRGHSEMHTDTKWPWTRSRWNYSIMLSLQDEVILWGFSTSMHTLKSLFTNSELVGTNSCTIIGQPVIQGFSYSLLKPLQLSATMGSSSPLYWWLLRPLHLSDQLEDLPGAHRCHTSLLAWWIFWCRAAQRYLASCPIQSDSVNTCKTPGDKNVCMCLTITNTYVMLKTVSINLRPNRQFSEMPNLDLIQPNT